MKRIDTCGRGCPQPVFLTKKALVENPEGVDIIVDNNTAKENVERFLKYSGYSMSVKEENDLIIIEARK